MSAKPWETPLNLYLDVAHVTEGHPSVEADGPHNLARATATMSEWDEVRVPERPELLFRVGRAGNVAVLDAETGTLMGGHTAFYPYVLPEYRGRNLNAEMSLIADNLGKRSRVSCYTRAGFGSRVTAHRLHVERALTAGHAVPDEVLRDYTMREGRLRLRNPYTPEAHTAWSEAQNRAARLARHQHEIEGCVEVFPSPEESGRNDFLRFGPDRDGPLLAIWLHREIGSGFLVHRQGNQCLVQAETEGMVVDCLGIRPSDLATEDLYRRGFLRNMDIRDPFFGTVEAVPVEVVRVGSEAELLAFLEPRLDQSMLPILDEAQIALAGESVPARRMRACDLLTRCPEMSF